MSFWTDLCDLLDCGRPSGHCQCGVPCTTNIISHCCHYVPQPLLDLPSSRVGDPWQILVIPLFITYWNSLMCYLSHICASGTLQLQLGYVNPWDPWWTTCLKCVYVLSRIQTERYDQIMRWWNSRLGQGSLKS